MCDLERFFHDLKEGILSFKLDLCCFVFSVKAGILLCGYFNIISSMICLISVSTGALPPLMMNAQQSFMEGEYIMSTCAFAYSSDLCLAVLMLCGMYRKDIVLLRYFTYCAMVMAASTVLVYSMVIGILSVLHTFLLVISLTYQVYLILLVRSEIVELKQEAKRKKMFYSAFSEYWTPNDVEASASPGPVEIYEVEETDTAKKTPEDVTVSPVSTSKAVVTTPATDLTTPIDNGTDNENTNKPSTSGIAKTDAKPETTEQPKALRYPYKFIAIKIPKEETIKEEKENEDKEKETSEEAVAKNDGKEETKDGKKRKRSIFSRKFKSKSQDGKSKNDDKNEMKKN